MRRFTISRDEVLAEEFDRLLATRGYGSRREAVRDLLRTQFEREREHRHADGTLHRHLKPRR